MNKCLISLVTLISLFSLPKLVSAVVFASDTVYLYKSGKKISDNAIYLASYKSWSDRCQNGLCTIGQQFYPVIVYLPKNGGLLTEPEFDSQNPYTGPEYGPEAGKAKDIWNAANTSSYLKYLDENSSSSISFNPGPSSGSEGCGYSGCLGGRIGSPRSLDLDLSSGKFNTHQTVTNTISGILDIFRQFFFLIVSPLQKIFPK